jgi:hypothetical protein
MRDWTKKYLKHTDFKYSKSGMEFGGSEIILHYENESLLLNIF